MDFLDFLHYVAVNFVRFMLGMAATLVFILWPILLIPFLPQLTDGQFLVGLAGVFVYLVLFVWFVFFRIMAFTFKYEKGLGQGH